MSAKCLLHVLLCKSCGTPSCVAWRGREKRNHGSDRPTSPILPIRCTHDSPHTGYSASVSDSSRCCRRHVTSNINYFVRHQRAAILRF